MRIRHAVLERVLLARSKILDHLSMSAETREIENAIRTYVATASPEATVPHDDDRLVEHGFVASMQLLDFVGFLEDTFAIRLRAGDLVPEKLATIAQIATVVRGATSRARRSSS